MKKAQTKVKWPINRLALTTLLLFILSAFAAGQEICNNSIDDDGDGLIDLNDIEDCACAGSTLTPLDLLPNPSFEDNNCCPQTFNFGQEICATAWQQGAGGSSDYLNTCGYAGGSAPLPFPDGEGAIGIAAGFLDQDNIIGEFVATCFNSSLEPTSDLSITLSISAGSLDAFGNTTTVPPADQPAPITIYGTENCFFPEPTFGCPEDFGWTVLGSTEYLPENSWSEITIDLNIEEPIAGLAFGIGCNMPESYQIDAGSILATYFYFDNLQLNSNQNLIELDPIEANYGPCNESVTLVAAAGNFTYQWYFEGVAINGETSDQLFIDLFDINEANAGQYQVVITDVNGNCTTQEAVAEILVNNLIIGGEPTSGCAPLQVSFDANLASGPQPLFWTVGDEIIEGLFFENTFTEPGIYPVSAQFTDANGCVFSAEFDPIIVEGSDELEIEFNVVNECAPFEVELATTNSSGNCEWTVPEGTIAGNDCSVTYFYDGEEDFNVDVISVSDCPSVGSAIIPISPAEIQPLEIEFEVLNGCAPFEVQLSTSSSTSGCNWTLEDGTIIGTDCSILYSYNGEEDFSVEVTTNGQCPSFGSANISIDSAEQGEYSIEGNFTFCEGDSSVISALPNTNTYIWNENFSGSSFTVFEAGTYQVQIIEPNGCDFFETFIIETSGGPEFNPPSSISGCIGDSFDFSEFSSSTQIAYDEPDFLDFQSFQGMVTVTASNDCGSVDRNVEFILEDCSCQIYIPNSFTPNGDGLNDLFNPFINCELNDYRMVIFNRWGNEVFATDTYDRGWDGNSGDEAFFANAGVYSYIIRYESALDPLNDPKEIVGSISLIR
ncbi:MAG: gliding motility-associated C-terminal domain-containing protein [Bacteroidota bacterium]